ncbi:MAG: ATP-binding protein [candidate division Zixibacteria bacterium]
MPPRLSSKMALVLFVILVLLAITQAVWWIVFMARLTDEKVDMARSLGGSPEFIDQVEQQEVRRQTMLGMEGLFFLSLTIVGAGLIYRSLVRAEALKFQQQNFMMATTHELKTPLASILVSIDTLKSEKIPDEKKKAIIPRIREDVRRLERIIDNILKASRLEKGDPVFTLQPTDLSNLIKKALSRINEIHTINSKSINGDVPDGVMVMGDPVALLQAIEAVIENCLKYHGGRPIQIDINLTLTQKKATVTIADNGIGLKPEERRAIFDRFYRVGSELTRQTEGTGLGLFVAHQIIRAHRGSIAVASDGLGKGCTFKIVLPRRIES